VCGSTTAAAPATTSPLVGDQAIGGPPMATETTGGGGGLFGAGRWVPAGGDLGSGGPTVREPKATGRGGTALRGLGNTVGPPPARWLFFGGRSLARGPGGFSGRPGAGFPCNLSGPHQQVWGGLVTPPPGGGGAFPTTPGRVTRKSPPGPFAISTSPGQGENPFGPGGGTRGAGVGAARPQQRGALRARCVIPELPRGGPGGLARFRARSGSIRPGRGLGALTCSGGIPRGPPERDHRNPGARGSKGGGTVGESFGTRTSSGQGSSHPRAADKGARNWGRGSGARLCCWGFQGPTHGPGHPRSRGRGRSFTVNGDPDRDGFGFFFAPFIPFFFFFFSKEFFPR